MSDRENKTENALAPSLAAMDQQELCKFVIALCGAVGEQADEYGYCGGLFPENIRLDEAGKPVIGPGKLSDWGEDERRFVAPELYWDGECGPASDVYSV